MPKQIIFCKHAENKISILKKHGFDISKEEIMEAVLRPDKIIPGEYLRKIAQRPFNSEKILRVIFEETKESIIIITFYPAKRSRYEN